VYSTQALLIDMNYSFTKAEKWKVNLYRSGTILTSELRVIHNKDENAVFVGNWFPVNFLISVTLKYIKLLALELFFFILAHSVHKM